MESTTISEAATRISSSAPESVKKLSFSNRIVLSVVSFLVKILYRTLRISADSNTRKMMSDKTSSALFCWHGSISMLPYVNKYLRHSSQMAGLMSASRDGSYLADFFRHFGVTAVRGSSSNNGKRAAISLIRILRGGGNICITPDGPRGPACEAKSGMFTISGQSEKSRMIFLKIDFYSCWRFNSWDGFKIPKPFSKVAICGIEYSDYSDFSAEVKRRGISAEKLCREHLG